MSVFFHQNESSMELKTHLSCSHRSRSQLPAQHLAHCRFSINDSYDNEQISALKKTHPFKCLRAHYKPGAFFLRVQRLNNFYPCRVPKLYLSTQRGMIPLPWSLCLPIPSFSLQWLLQETRLFSSPCPLETCPLSLHSDTMLHFLQPHLTGLRFPLPKYTETVYYTKGNLPSQWFVSSSLSVGARANTGLQLLQLTQLSFMPNARVATETRNNISGIPHSPGDFGF